MVNQNLVIGKYKKIKINRRNRVFGGIKFVMLKNDVWTCDFFGKVPNVITYIIKNLAKML